MSVEIGSLRTHVSGSEASAPTETSGAAAGDGASAHEEQARLRAELRRLERDRLRTRAEGFDD